MNKKELHTCELCGKTDEKVTLFIGGPWTYIHESCAEIAEKAIEGYLKRIVSMQYGITYLAEELIRAEKELHGSEEKAEENDNDR